MAGSIIYNSNHYTKFEVNSFQVIISFTSPIFLSICKVKMKHSTYQILYQAHLGAIDKKALLQAQSEESDPYYKNIIDMIIQNKNSTIPWDIKTFTTDFLSGNPRQKLDETFFAFVLRTVVIIKEESYFRTFQKPESHSAFVAWVAILRNILINSLALLYNVKWTPETIIVYLEPALIKFFSENSASVLRQLMTNLGINLAQEQPYLAELFFENLGFLSIFQFSSFYWRFLHWMAEAVNLRNEDMILYKNEWRQLLKGPIYRTLRCVICMDHFKKMLIEYESEITDGDMGKLFFTIHNRTHAMRRESYKFLQEPDYTESQYEADAQFMRQALLQ